MQHNMKIKSYSFSQKIRKKMLVIASSAIAVVSTNCRYPFFPDVSGPKNDSGIQSWALEYAGLLAQKVSWLIWWHCRYALGCVLLQSHWKKKKQEKQKRHAAFFNNEVEKPETCFKNCYLSFSRDWADNASSKGVYVSSIYE